MSIVVFRWSGHSPPHSSQVDPTHSSGSCSARNSPQRGGTDRWTCGRYKMRSQCRKYISPDIAPPMSCRPQPKRCLDTPPPNCSAAPGMCTLQRHIQDSLLSIPHCRSGRGRRTHPPHYWRTMCSLGGQNRRRDTGTGRETRGIPGAVQIRCRGRSTAGLLIGDKSLSEGGWH